MEKGSKMSKESCEKMRLAKLGKKHSHKTSNGSHWEMSSEAKEKIKKGLMGNKNGSGSKGKHIQRNNALEVWRKNGGKPWNAGTKGLVKVWNKGLSNEKTRAGAKIAQDALRGKPAWNRGKPATWMMNGKSKLCGTHTEWSRMGGLRSMEVLSLRNPTSIEKKLYQELKRQNISFNPQYLINDRFLVDAYIPSLNLVIEADGDYWHGLDKIRKKDKAENAYLLRCGYKLLRLSEKEINKKDWSLPII